MSFTNILYEIKEGKIGLITLNRPEKMNSFNNEVCRELAQALKMAEKDDAVRVLVLTGAGKAFSAGGELAALTAADTVFKKREILDNAAMIVEAVDRFEKPLIAAVNGVAAGAGTAIALACDIIIASDKARFAPNFVNIAALPDSGASWFLPRKVGYHKAAELMLSGAVLDAGQAYSLGIFNRVVEDERLYDEVFTLAQSLARGPSRAIAKIKKMLKMSFGNSLASQLELEASYQLLAWEDEDFKEGVAAFLQKRKPVFK